LDKNSSQKIDNSINQKSLSGSQVTLQIEIRFSIQKTKQSGGKCDESETLRPERFRQDFRNNRKSETAVPDVEEQQVDDQRDGRDPQRCGAVVAYVKNDRNEMRKFYHS